jgi:hypothetical protein
MKILIATPVFGSVCTVPYTDTMVRLVRAFQRDRPSVALAGPRFLASSQVSFSRNVFASMVLEEPSFTHLFFVDSDIGFAPNLLARMLEFDKPFVGALCPERPPAPTGRFVGEDELIPGAVAGGFQRARQVGAGVLLLQRQVLERLAEAYPDLLVAVGDSMADMRLKANLFQCFEHLCDERGRYLSEDISFCRRWTSLGGEVWVCIDEEITHSGMAHVSGSIASRSAPP